MSQLGLLQDLVLVFAVAVAVVAVLRRVGVPSIAGFILSGMLVGPNVLGLIGNVHDVELLAEVGVVLLLFGIGLDLSLDHLRRLLKPILAGGTLQVGVTILAVLAAGALFGYGLRASVFLGFVVAASSTAIVLRGLAARGELDAPHGMLTLGILVFQDLSVVPMMLLMPLLSGRGGSPAEVLLALAKALAVLALVLVAERLVVPRVLHWIARTRQRDLFVLTVFLVCFGTAWAVSGVGISLALGAFLGGLVVAGSDYRHRALGELIPFREVLTSIFFISVGMLLDPRVVLREALPVLGLLATIVVGKAALVMLTGALMRLPLRVSVLAGAALAQVGEFSFVLMRAAEGTDLLREPMASRLLIAVILSMLITPVALALGPHLAAGVVRIRSLTRLMDVSTPADAQARIHGLRDHVVIAGYGVTGQELARALHAAAVPYVIVDLNAENVRAGAQRQEPIFYGDISSPELQELLGLDSARELVIVINDPSAAVRAIRAVRAERPDLPILVRTRYIGDAEPLLRAGATRVVPAEIEAAVEVTTRVLQRHGVAPEAIEAQRARIRTRHEEGLGNEVHS
ncbi:MAG: cation:proton antiporter [Candidatus Lambdaproteobacteria bacterium]|nr:cation:proton antiporter [Candidatus Lambdaproteobacteria bacterium]